MGWIMLNRLNRWNRVMNRKTLATMELGGGERVLELGSGGGALLGMIADRMSTGKVIGIDWSPLAIRFCKYKLRRFIDQGKLELICQNALQVPLPDNFIDCICTVNTVYFWEQPGAVLAECSRVLKRGGRIVLCNAVLSELGSDDYPAEYFTSHAVDEVMRDLQALGFAQPALDYGQDAHADFYTLRATLQAE